MKSILSKTIALTAVAAGVMAAPAVASAAEGPIAGCGVGQVLLTVEQTIDDPILGIDWRIYTPDEKNQIVTLVKGVNRNGDGYLCTKQWKPNQGRDKHWGATDLGISDYIVITISDNNARGRTP